MIINKTLHFSKPSFLNDPLDCYTEVNIKNKGLIPQKTVEKLFSRFSDMPYSLKYYKHCMTLNTDKTLQHSFIRDFCQFHTNEQHLISSFSRTLYEDLLWSHYADSAKGLCIVFNKDELLQSLANNVKDNNHKISSDFVRYSKTIKKLDVLFYEKNGHLFKMSQKHLFTKKINWKYEKEFRIVVQKYDRIVLPLKQQLVFNQNIPFSGSSIHSIIMGERISTNNRALLESILTSDKGDYHLLEYFFGYTK